MTNAFNRC